MTNQPTTKKQGITSYLSTPQMQTYLNDVIGNNKEKFVTNLVSVTNQNKELQKCTNMSLVSGALVATTLNLSLNSSFGYAYLVPFKNRKQDTIEAQFQIGYKGYIQLALRTGEYARLNAVPIYKSQFQSWNALTEELEINSFDNFENDEVMGYVAFFRLKNGFEKTMFWSKEKMERHADKYSQAFSLEAYNKLQKGEIPKAELWKYSSFWYKDFDEMALKTMLRQLLSKYGIMSEEMQTAYINDQSVVVDNTPNYIESEAIEMKPQPIEEVNKYQVLINNGVNEDNLQKFMEQNNLTDENLSSFISDVAGMEQAIEDFNGIKI